MMSSANSILRASAKKIERGTVWSGDVAYDAKSLEEFGSV